VNDIANTNTLELLGRKAAEVVNESVFGAIPALQEQGFKQLLNDVYQTGNRFSASELSIQIHREGKLETNYINFSYEALYDSFGEIDGIFSIDRDVTDQVVARKKIEANEKKLTMVIDASELGTYDLDNKTKN